MLAALSDLGYNWGTGNVKKSVLLGLINSGAPQADIADQWNKTAITSAGAYDADLANRRIAEQNLAFSGGTDVLGIVALAVAALFILFFIGGSRGKH